MEVPAGLFRRLGAVIYDTFILLALLLFAAALAQPILYHYQISAQNFFFRLYLLSVWFSFFAWFWLKNGQTIGMLAWKLRLKSITDEPLTLKQVCLRLATAIPAYLLGGIGLFWLIFDKEKLAWHDRASNTKMVKE